MVAGMLVQRAYKTELDLSDRQVTTCRQHAGAARWAYNGDCGSSRNGNKAAKKAPTAIELHRELNALKKTAVPWMYARLQMCATGSPLEPGCRLPAVLSPLRPQKAGEVGGQAGVSPVQDQEEGPGELPTHWPDRGLREGDRVAAAGAAAPQRARVSAH